MLLVAVTKLSVFVSFYKYRNHIFKVTLFLEHPEQRCSNLFWKAGNCLSTDKVYTQKELQFSYFENFSSRKMRRNILVLFIRMQTSLFIFLIIKPTRCTNSQIYFWNKTLHVSDSSSVHHQDFFTVHTAMVYVLTACEQDQDGTGSVLILPATYRV